MELKLKIKEIYERRDKTVGYRRIQDEPFVCKCIEKPLVGCTKI